MKKNKLSKKAKFLQSMAEPDAGEFSLMQLGVLFVNYALTGLYLVFIISAAYVTFSSPDPKVTAANFIARLLAASAARTGNSDLPTLLTGLVAAIVILTALALWTTTLFRGDHKEIVEESLVTTHYNMMNLAEKLADMDEILKILHQRLVIEPAMEKLGEHEGAIDRQTGEIVYVGKLDEYDFDPDQVLLRLATGYCPICKESYELRHCPECHNPAVPNQVDLDCQVCGGTGKYGHCKLNHQAAEKRAFENGPTAYRLYGWSKQVQKLARPFGQCTCGKINRFLWWQVGKHDACLPF